MALSYCQPLAKQLKSIELKSSSEVAITVEIIGYFFRIHRHRIGCFFRRLGIFSSSSAGYLPPAYNEAKAL
jgi:hypothetical protein